MRIAASFAGEVIGRELPVRVGDTPALLHRQNQTTGISGITP
jgi:hypothetical protein